MKNFILVVAMLAFCSQAFAGLKLKCDTPDSIDQLGGGTILTAGTNYLNCADKEDNKFTLLFIGVGAGIDLIVDSSITVKCPLVSKKRIMKGHGLTVYGPRITAGAKKGIDIGLGLNVRAAFCSFTGINTAYGASALIGGFAIRHRDK